MRVFTVIGAPMHEQSFVVGICFLVAPVDFFVNSG